MTVKQIKWAYPDVRIGLDKDTLRLQFSTRVSQKYYGKRQYYKGLGRPNTSNNYQWATHICQRIQLDLDHPDNLFDPTLEKYLGSNLVLLPTAKLTPKLGNSFLDFAERRFKLGKIQESTYKRDYKGGYFNLIKQWKDESITRELAEIIIDSFSSSPKNQDRKIKILSLLVTMGDWLVEKEELPKNVFKGLKDAISIPKRNPTNYTDESLGDNDYHSFTQEERDIIIKGFYDAPKRRHRQIAPLIEFLFLTGCRPGEAFPLLWNDIKWQKRAIVFHQSYESRSKVLSTNRTKTGVIRIFPFYPKLEAFLRRIYEETYEGDNNKLVFTNTQGNQFNVMSMFKNWHQDTNTHKGKTYVYDGVVTQLVKEGKIKQYLKPYSTRHTFITLQVLGALNDPNDKTNFIGQIKFIADIVGNSVETIQKHYLDRPREAYVLDI